MKKRFLNLLLLLGLVSAVLLGGRLISANENAAAQTSASVDIARETETKTAQPPTLKIMAERSKEDSSLLETLDRFSDEDAIVAYPDHVGGGFSILPAGSPEALVGQILDNDGETVVYQDDQPVTIAQVKEAIREAD